MVQGILSKIKSVLKTEEVAALKKVDFSLLESTGNPGVKKLKDVLEFVTTQNSWSPSEDEALQKVDAIKKQYLNSHKKVIMKDFGSGPKNSIRDEEAMKSGVDREVVISDVLREAATRERWGRLMFKIVREFKFNHCLELGTNLGISAAYQLSALKLNNKGRLDTIEGAEVYAKLAEEKLSTLNFSNFKVHIGKFSDVLPEILTPNIAIDFAFIDGHHDEKATKKYFEMIYPFLAPKAMIIFDDISWSNGMKNVWQSIYRDPRIQASIDTHKWGICFIDKTIPTSTLQYLKLQHLE